MASLPSTVPWRWMLVRSAGPQALALSVGGRHLGTTGCQPRETWKSPVALFLWGSRFQSSPTVSFPALVEKEEYEGPDVEEAFCTGFKNCTSFQGVLEEAKKELARHIEAHDI